MSCRFILVRHGESTYNEQGIIQGCSDIPVLTRKGQIDSRNLGLSFQGIKIDTVYTSNLRRSKETAAEILSAMYSDTKDFPVTESLEILREVDLTDWMNLSRDVVKERFTTSYSSWLKYPHMLQTQEGSFPVLDLYERAKQFWHEMALKHNEGNILIVGHSGTNRALIGAALDIPPSKYHLLAQSNCGVSIIRFDHNAPQKGQLEFLNLAQHSSESIPSLKKDKEYLRMILVRHTETDWNWQRRFQGQLDIPLNQDGINHAMCVADLLKHVDIDLAVCSALRRPVQTAEIILRSHEKVDLEKVDSLIEMNYGVWQGKTEIEIEDQYPRELDEWRESPGTLQIEQAESLNEVWERVSLVWKSLVESTRSEATRTKTCLVVAHDVTNRIILCDVLGLREKNFWSLKQINGGISIIDYPLDGHSPIIHSMNIPTEQIKKIVQSEVAWNV